MPTQDKALRAGGVAVVQSRHYGKFTYQYRVIERETKLYWVVDGSKYRKSDGHQPGDSVWIGHSKTLITLEERNRRRDAR